MLCALILYATWRGLHFNVDSERQIFEKLFHGSLFYSHNFCQKFAERKPPKKYFSYFIFHGWPGIRTQAFDTLHIRPQRLYNAYIILNFMPYMSRHFDYFNNNNYAIVKIHLGLYIVSPHSSECNLALPSSWIQPWHIVPMNTTL